MEAHHIRSLKASVLWNVSPLKETEIKSTDTDSFLAQALPTTDEPPCYWENTPPPANRGVAPPRIPAPYSVSTSPLSLPSPTPIFFLLSLRSSASLHTGPPLKVSKSLPGSLSPQHKHQHAQSPVSILITPTPSKKVTVKSTRRGLG